MIKKLNLALIVAVLVILAIKYISELDFRSRGSGDAVAVGTVRNAGFAPRVHYCSWHPYAAENPLTNRNGYLLDIVRAIFPRAVFVNDIDDVKDVVARFESEPDAITVCFGDHPLLEKFPAAPTPIGFVNIALYTSRTNPWVYTGPESLKGLRIGCDIDYLDSAVIRDHEPKTVFDSSVYHDRRFDMIGKEIDAFVTANDGERSLMNDTSLAEHMNFRVSKTIDRCALRFRVNSSDPEKAKLLLDAYEAGMKEITASGELSRLREYYRISD